MRCDICHVEVKVTELYQCSGCGNVRLCKKHRHLREGKPLCAICADDYDDDHGGRRPPRFSTRPMVCKCESRVHVRGNFGICEGCRTAYIIYLNYKGTCLTDSYERLAISADTEEEQKAIRSTFPEIVARWRQADARDKGKLVIGKDRPT